MAAGIGAAGILGVAREAAAGTWLTPAKFIPIRSESLAFAQETVFTRPIQEVADIVHAVPGNATVEGDIEFEVTHDNLPWFLGAMRGDLVVSGAAPPYIYTLTPNSIGQKSATLTTLSITIVRNGIVFGYVNCVVGKLQITVDDGILVATVSILAQDETVQALPTASWPTAAPFGAGQYVMEIPTAAQVFDVNGFTFSVDDGAEHAYRLRDDGRGAMFTKFGERSTEITLERDFDSRTDYDAFKALTAQAVHFRAEDPAEAGNYVDILMDAAIKDTYEIGLDGQGDLVMASIVYQGIYSDSDSRSYVLECGSATEIIT